MRGPASLRDPWKYQRDYWPTLPVDIADIDPDLNGYTQWRRDRPPRVVLSDSLDDIGQRVTLTHELFHLECGQPDRWHRDRGEKLVRLLTARWLLPDLDLVKRALAMSVSIEDAAERLWVTLDVLVERLRHLTPNEAHLVHSPQARAFSHGHGGVVLYGLKSHQA